MQIDVRNVSFIFAAAILGWFATILALFSFLKCLRVSVSVERKILHFAPLFTANVVYERWRG